MAEREQLLRISKLDAARRQLDAALLLYFNDGDPIAVHTLAAATHGILRDLAQKSGSHTLIERSLLHSVGEDLTMQAMGATRAVQNFLKHADRDPDAVLEFSPESTILQFLDSAATYLEITGEQTLLQRALETWLLLHYPWLWKSTNIAQRAADASKFFGGMARREFLAKFMNTAVLLDEEPR